MAYRGGVLLGLEVRFQKKHVFIELPDEAPVVAIKNMMSKLLQIPADQYKIVWRQDGENWKVLGDEQTLAQAGFSQNNARVQHPAVVGMLKLGQDEPQITPLSGPPPVPDSLRNDNHD
ncbi:unnamed protein product, partial [Mesorhabditis spiculigera]